MAKERVAPFEFGAALPDCFPRDSAVSLAPPQFDPALRETSSLSPLEASRLSALPEALPTLPFSAASRAQAGSEPAAAADAPLAWPALTPFPQSTSSAFFSREPRPAHAVTRGGPQKRCAAAFDSSRSSSLDADCGWGVQTPDSALSGAEEERSGDNAPFFDRKRLRRSPLSAFADKSCCRPRKLFGVAHSRQVKKVVTKRLDCLDTASSLPSLAIPLSDALRSSAPAGWLAPPASTSESLFSSLLSSFPTPCSSHVPSEDSLDVSALGPLHADSRASSLPRFLSSPPKSDNFSCSSDRAPPSALRPLSSQPSPSLPVHPSASFSLPASSASWTLSSPLAAAEDCLGECIRRQSALVSAEVQMSPSGEFRAAEAAVHASEEAQTAGERASGERGESREERELTAAQWDVKRKMQETLEQQMQLYRQQMRQSESSFLPAWGGAPSMETFCL
ncbi:hypothetical protein TGPRC2_297790 [Toxoplasma gondii TgCatPRC2]|uniref:Uncharacterized protein n=1 Tax=Toxoplasma gondii TgCatPRC2 TaxID=1130821 RepID=A0A151H1X1_TOXGO|nr:hypothetical protein TGPRC2_297790 [Toxoplasma gondii TgCatPRC2]